MSSGTLPLATYHRTSHLGSGSFGSVVTVYNDDGEEFALKLFLDGDADDDGGNNDNDSNDDSDYISRKPIGLGVLREISCLRLLRGHHPNIIKMIDIQPEWNECEDQQGAGTAGCISMAIPLYRNGSLADAIARKTFVPYPKITKIKLSHGILSAVAFLHDNGIIHRDIKSDNILLETDNDTEWKPILIDFSLAKPVTETIWTTSPSVCTSDVNEAVQHTGDVGTVVYTAPEIINGDSYGLLADMFSVGVVLLELVQGCTFTAVKSKEALAQIQDAVHKLPTDAPFPNLIRSLLQYDPDERITARQALQHTLFTEKFSMEIPSVRYVNVATALPHEDHDDADSDNDGQTENDSPNVTNKKNGNSINQSTKKVGKNKKSKEEIKIENRIKMINKICTDLESTNPLTNSAAYEYSTLLEQLDESIDQIDQSQSLLDCIVLAHRFYEFHLLDLDELSDNYPKYYSDWSLEEYVDNESSIFMMMDYCLYPRNLIDMK